MCTCVSEARPCGVASAVRSMWDRVRGHQPRPIEAMTDDEFVGELDRRFPGGPDDPDAWERRKAAIHARHVLRTVVDGDDLCARCETRIDDEDASPLNPEWCDVCTTNWLTDRIVGPLVARVGRRAARRMLLRLVADVKAMT